MYTKMIRNLKLLPLIYLFAAWNGAYCQDYMIYKDNGKFICIDLETKNKLIENNSASEVIQFAIDKSHNQGGGEIMLGKGFFELSTPLRLKDNIWLHGKRRATELQLKAPNDRCIELIGVSNVRVSELTFSPGNNDNLTTGIYGENTSNCNIHDILLLSFAQSGIYLTKNNSEIDINRCTFIDNVQEHIFLNEIRGSNQSSVVVSNCTFFAGGYGIKGINRKYKTNKLKIKNNISAYLKGPLIDTNADSVVVYGNRIYWGQSDGMRIKGKGFHIEGNMNCWIRGHGLVLDGAKDGTVEGNNITDLGVRSRDGMRKCGVVMYNTSQVTISGNSIWNWGDQGYIEYAIYEDENCSNNKMFANAGWFHAHPDGFKSFGTESSLFDNTSNQGEYRGDFWDFTQKFAAKIDEYINSLRLDKDVIPITYQDTKPFEVNGEKVIECKDMFQQVISFHNETIKKYGWTGSENQIWILEKSGDYYLIRNKKNQKLLQCDSNEENAPVTLANRNNGDAQLWNIISIGNGYFKIINKLNAKVLQSEGLSNYSWEKNNVVYQGQQLVVSDYKNRESQMWRFRDPMPSYTIKNVD
jgi:hypothetical protein